MTHKSTDSIPSEQHRREPDFWKAVDNGEITFREFFHRIGAFNGLQRVIVQIYTLPLGDAVDLNRDLVDLAGIYDFNNMNAR